MRRVRFISILLCAFVLVLLARLYYLQIMQGEVYAAKEDRQYINPSETLFDRGSIYFTANDGTEVAAATLGSGFLLSLNPQKVSDPAGVYERLSAIIPLDREKFFARAQKQNDTYEEVAHQISADNGAAIDALNLPGVSIYREKWRYYPAGELGSSVVGFVGYNDDGMTFSGRYGLERYYDDTLARKGGGYDSFFSELFSDVRKLGGTNGRGEGDIVTGIEPTVEKKLEDTLRSVNDTWQSTETGGIVIEPKTGTVVAMGVYPTFDPNHYGSVGNISLLDNPLVDKVFEMGSIVKPLTMASGIDAGVVTAQTTYLDKGCDTLDKKTFCNFDGKGRGTVSMQDVLNQSLNTGAAYVVSRLGNKRFADYLKHFGIGEETGIDLPSEAAGIVGNLESPRDIEYATASFGQGIAVTPIAITRALATLANHGRLPSPHVATEIRYRSGLVDPVSPPGGEQVIKEDTADEITRMLVTVVDTSLLQGRVKEEHYSIAAKTGTAQIAKPGGGYYDDRYLHSFFGYFPAYDAKFLVFLFTLEPQGVNYASQTLTLPFKNIADFLINYYAIPPDR